MDEAREAQVRLALRGVRGVVLHGDAERREHGLVVARLARGEHRVRDRYGNRLELLVVVVVVVIRLCDHACLAHPLALEPLAEWPILFIVLHIGGDRLGSRRIYAIRKGPILLLV